MTDTIMPVVPSAMLALLSHELRSPVSVLQGYLRLLQRSPEGLPPDPAVLDGMRSATSQLAELGRDAARLARWLDAPESPSTLITLPALHEQLASALAGEHRLAPLPEALESRLFATTDSEAFVRAVTTCCQAVGREREAAGTEVTVCDIGPAEFCLAVDPIDGASSAAVRPFSFKAGGVGLALLVAEAVLSRHGATVSDRPSGGLEIALPCEQEAA